MLLLQVLWIMSTNLKKIILLITYKWCYRSIPFIEKCIHSRSKIKCITISIRRCTTISFFFGFSMLVKSYMLVTSSLYLITGFC
jgi:hypothetical protein